MSKWIKYTACASALLLGASYGGRQLKKRANLKPYRSFFRDDTDRSSSGESVTATFLGTTTLLISDGETHLMLDGFFTRPSNQLKLFLGKIKTNHAFVKDALQKLGVNKLDAVMVFHSHYDHVMDAPTVAGLTGAKILGSQSTAYVAQGAGLPASQIHIVTPGNPMRFGHFTVTFIQSKHLRLPWVLEKMGLTGNIEKEVQQPASMFDYKEGGTYAILIEHPLGSCMLHSAAFNKGELKDYHTDTILMCTPGLDKMSLETRKDYFNEVVEQTGAKRIIPIHWDDFMAPLSQPLVPMPNLASNFDKTMEILKEYIGHHSGTNLEFLKEWKKIKIF